MSPSVFGQPRQQFENAVYKSTSAAPAQQNPSLLPQALNTSVDQSKRTNSLNARNGFQTKNYEKFSNITGNLPSANKKDARTWKGSALKENGGNDNMFNEEQRGPAQFPSVS